MKPSAIRIERLLAQIEAKLVPPPRKCLRIIIHEGDDDEVVAKMKEKALAEHVASHPEDVGRTVDDFRWIQLEIGKEPAVVQLENGQWIGSETLKQEQRQQQLKQQQGNVGNPQGSCSEPLDGGEFEDTDKDTDGPSETLVEPIALPPPAPSCHDGPFEPIDLPPPNPVCLARSKPWRPVHQRPARDQRRPTWKKWER
jgi:hypothetical protein